MFQVTAVKLGTVGWPILPCPAHPHISTQPLKQAQGSKVPGSSGESRQDNQNMPGQNPKSSERHCLDDSKQEDGLEEHLPVAAESQGGSLEAGSSLPEVSLAPSDRCLRKKVTIPIWKSLTTQEMLEKY